MSCRHRHALPSSAAVAVAVVLASTLPQPAVGGLFGRSTPRWRKRERRTHGDTAAPTPQIPGVTCRLTASAAPTAAPTASGKKGKTASTKKGKKGASPTAGPTLPLCVVTLPPSPRPTERPTASPSTTAPTLGPTVAPTAAPTGGSTPPRVNQPGSTTISPTATGPTRPPPPPQFETLSPSATTAQPTTAQPTTATPTTATPTTATPTTATPTTAAPTTAAPTTAIPTTATPTTATPTTAALLTPTASPTTAEEAPFTVPPTVATPPTAPPVTAVVPTTAVPPTATDAAAPGTDEVDETAGVTGGSAGGGGGSFTTVIIFVIAALVLIIGLLLASVLRKRVQDHVDANDKVVTLNAIHFKERSLSTSPAAGPDGYLKIDGNDDEDDRAASPQYAEPSVGPHSGGLLTHAYADPEDGVGAAQHTYDEPVSRNPRYTLYSLPSELGFGRSSTRASAAAGQPSGRDTVYLVEEEAALVPSIPPAHYDQANFPDARGNVGARPLIPADYATASPQTTAAPPVPLDSGYGTVISATDSVDSMDYSVPADSLPSRPPTAASNPSPYYSSREPGGAAGQGYGQLTAANPTYLMDEKRNRASQILTYEVDADADGGGSGSVATATPTLLPTFEGTPPRSVSSISSYGSTQFRPRAAQPAAVTYDDLRAAPGPSAAVLAVTGGYDAVTDHTATGEAGEGEADTDRSIYPARSGKSLSHPFGPRSSTGSLVSPRCSSGDSSHTYDAVDFGGVTGGDTSGYNRRGSDSDRYYQAHADMFVLGDEDEDEDAC